MYFAKIMSLEYQIGQFYLFTRFLNEIINYTVLHRDIKLVVLEEVKRSFSSVISNEN